MRAARKRGVQCRLIRDSDIAPLYLGYQRGAFDEEFVDENEALQGLSKNEFAQLLQEFSNSAEIWVTVANTAAFEKRDSVPIAMWWVYLKMPHLIEPHVVWMPWASPRQKIEGWLNFIIHQRVDREIGIFNEKQYGQFFRLLARYGVLDRIGTWPHYFPNDNAAEVWRVTG